jgi:hypothetical protein
MHRMNDPLVLIRLDANGRVYWPGETLSGEYRIDAARLAEIKSVEVSVLWYTEGKGDEDLAVHYFRRRSVEDDLGFDPRQPERFSTVLPNSPFSYDGLIVKIRWCVRVRVFMARGKEVVGEKAFQLGPLPAAKAPVL